MYEVLYRKHRPRDFAGIIGQEHVTIPLQKALEKSIYSHAYVFAGPRGTGKTSTARVLAKYLNCLSEDKPCGKCESCTSIDHSSYMDVVELDAASYRGIDEIRKIRDGAGYRPVMGRTKVYIIDEFHMLTREAFNALLKTLEEPPQNTVFILATTNLEKVPDTVISRCQVFQFRPLSDADIESYLTSVTKKEGIDPSSEALHLIARHARGSMRDAVNVLERVASVADHISLDDVHRILGLVPKDSVEEYLLGMINGEFDLITKVSGTVSQHGLSYDQLVTQALDLLKTRLVEGSISLKSGVLVGTALWEIFQELRSAMDKKSVFEVLSIVKMQRLEKSHPVGFAEAKETPGESTTEPVRQTPIAEKETTDKTTFSNCLDSLYQKRQILLWSVLKMADVEEKDKSVSLRFSPEAHFARTIFDEQFELIQSMVLKEVGKSVLIENEQNRSARVVDENKTEEDTREKKEQILQSLPEKQRDYVRRIVRLFGDDVELSVDNGEEDKRNG